MWPVVSGYNFKACTTWYKRVQPMENTVHMHAKASLIISLALYFLCVVPSNPCNHTHAS